MANVLRWLTGFEGWPTGIPPTGLVSGVTGSPSVGTAYARPDSHGTQGLQAHPNPSADESVDMFIVSGGQAVAAASCWHKPVTLDNSSDYGLFAISAVSGGYAYIGIDMSNKYSLYASGGTKLITGPDVPTGQWNYIELLADMRSNPWVLKWRINGVDQTDSSGYTATASTFRRVGVGAFATGNRTCEHWFDDIVVIDGTDTTMWLPGIGAFDVEAITADQTAAAEHQSIVTTEVQYTDNFSSFTDFASSTETDSRSRIDDLASGDGIQLQGASTLTLPTARAVGAKSNGTTSAVTIAAPTGVATGDLEVMVVETTTTCSITSQGGTTWTAMTGSPFTVSSPGRNLYVWWRIRGASDTNPTVTAATDQLCGFRICYTAGTFDTGTPFELITGGSEAATDTSFSSGALGSTSGDNRLVCCVTTIFKDSNTGGIPQMTNANLASVTNSVGGTAINYCTVSGNGGGVGYTQGSLATAGAAGTFACTYDTASYKAWVSWAIRPASSAGGALTGNLRYPVADPTNTDVPTGVALITLSRESAASGTSNAIFRTLVSASTTDHFNADPAWGTTWTYVQSCMSAKPGGGSWTLSDVQGIKFEVDSTDCGPPYPWLAGFIYEVAFPALLSTPKNDTDTNSTTTEANDPRALVTPDVNSTTTEAVPDRKSVFADAGTISEAITDRKSVLEDFGLVYTGSGFGLEPFGMEPFGGTDPGEVATLAAAFPLTESNSTTEAITARVIADLDVGAGADVITTKISITTDSGTISAENGTLGQAKSDSDSGTASAEDTTFVAKAWLDTDANSTTTEDASTEAPISKSDTDSGTATSEATTLKAVHVQTDSTKVEISWGTCGSVTLTQSTRQKEMDDMMAVRGYFPRYDHSDPSGDIATRLVNTGFTKWVALIGGDGASWPSNATFLNYCNAHPNAWIETINEANLNGVHWSPEDIAQKHIDLYAYLRGQGVTNVIVLGSIGNSYSPDPGSMHPLEWARRLAVAGCIAGAAFDVANYHMYDGGPTGYDAWQHCWTPDGSGNSMQKYFGYPPFIVTEFGWPLSDAGTEAAQAGACEDWMDAFKAQPKCIGACWYALSNDAQGGGTGYGLRASDGVSHKLAWDSFYTKAAPVIKENETQVVHLTDTDTGTSSEAIGSRASTLTDTGTASAESGTKGGDQALTDTDTGTASAEATALVITSSDTGSSSETITDRKAVLPDTDNTSNEVITLTAPYAVIDTGSDSEAISTRVVADTDTGTATEVITAKASVDADTATGTDVAVKIVTATDSGTSAEVVADRKAVLTETSAGDDTFTETYQPAVTDTFAGTDAVSGRVSYADDLSTTAEAVGSRAIVYADTGSALSEQASFGNTYSGFETGSGVDDITQRALVAPETNVTVESATAGILVSSSDSGSGVDAFAIKYVLDEVGSGSDVTGTRASSATDTGSGSDVIFARYAEKTDSASGSEASQEAVSLTDSEQPTTSEAINALSRAVTDNIQSVEDYVEAAVYADTDTFIGTDAQTSTITSVDYGTITEEVTVTSDYTNAYYEPTYAIISRAPLAVATFEEGDKVYVIITRVAREVSSCLT